MFAALDLAQGVVGLAVGMGFAALLYPIRSC
jgi:hypothetical protein